MAGHWIIETSGEQPARFLCSCGWSTGPCETWEQAGRYLDNHVALENGRGGVNRTLVSWSQATG